MLRASAASAIVRTFKRTVLNGSWPLVREFGFRNAGNCCLGRGISPLESGKQVEKSGMPITIGIQIPSSTKKAWSPVPGIQNPRRGIQNPRLSWIPLHGSEAYELITRKIYILFLMSLSKVCQSLQGSKYKYLQKYLFLWNALRKRFAFTYEFHRVVKQRFTVCF